MIRITLGTMPSLLREIIASALASEPDFVVSESGGGPGQSGFDVLLLCQGAGAGVALDDLVHRPPPAIIALDAGGEQARVLTFACREEQLAAPGDLCGIVREAAASQQDRVR